MIRHHLGQIKRNHTPEYKITMVMHVGEMQVMGDIVQVRLDAAATSAIEAFHVCPSLDILVPTIIQHGAEHLHEHIALTPGVTPSPL